MRERRWCQEPGSGNSGGSGREGPKMGYFLTRLLLAEVME